MSCDSDEEALGELGTEQNLKIRQGADFTVYVTLTNPPEVVGDPETPVSLVGGELRGQMRREPDSATAVDFVFDRTDEVAGQFTFGFPNAVTAALVCGPTLSHPLSRYVYDVEFVEPSGRVRPVYFGVVRVWREVTRTP